MSLPNPDFIVKNVNDFKSLFRANPNLIRMGQFYCQNHAWEAVEKITDAELQAASRQPDAVAGAIRKYFAPADWEGDEDGGPMSKHVILAREVVKAIRQSNSEATYPRTLKAFTPDPTAGTWARGLHREVWGNDNIPPPTLLMNPSADMILQARLIEADKCYHTTGSMAKKYFKARNKPATGLPWTPPFTPAGSYQLGKPILTRNGTTVVYNDATGLQDALTKMRDSIARGFIYVVGVVSGAKHDGTGTRKFPYPEHWLMVYANNGADDWVFWDSDSETSNIAGLRTGPGFGMLRKIPEHFSTAFDGPDFTNLAPGDDGGPNYHALVPMRHRYQAYTAEPKGP
jgi:hypothetical protein